MFSVGTLRLIINYGEASKITVAEVALFEVALKLDSINISRGSLRLIESNTGSSCLELAFVSKDPETASMFFE